MADDRLTVPAPDTAEAEAWIVAVSDWVPRAELIRMRRERDAFLELLGQVTRGEVLRGAIPQATRRIVEAADALNHQERDA